MCHHLDHLAAAEWEATEAADADEDSTVPAEEAEETTDDPPVDPELVVPTPT